MGSADWTEATSGLNGASVDRGVTTGIARPPGGGAFIFGFNSLVNTPGAVAFYTNQVNFAPTLANKGGSIRGAIQRGPSAGAIKFSPFFFLLGQGTDVADSAYILGLQDDDPHRIALRKGSLVQGLPSASPGSSGILRRSTATFANGKYLQLRLDAIVNLNGDVILKVFQNDLDALGADVTTPIWAPVAGIENPALVGSHGAGTAFVDDALAINSGSAPFTSGYMGYGFQTGDISRRGFFDQIEAMRQS